MQLSDVLSSDPEVVSGAVVFKGTRVPVRAVFENLVAGMSMDDILRNFPSVEREQMEEVLRLGLESLESHFADGHELA